MLSTDSLSKYIHGKTLYQDISLSVMPNHITALLGANGAGKSSVFHTLAGVTHPDHGKVLLQDQDITSLALYERAALGIGYLPQQLSLFQDLSISDNILAALELNPKHQDVASQRQALEELLQEFKLENIRSSKASLCSGGEKRRTEIARILACSPKYILMDEPFAGVDPKSIKEIKAMLRYLQSTHKLGILISDHSANETLEIADTAYVMHQGRLLAKGTSKEIANHPDVLQHYFGQN